MSDIPLRKSLRRCVFAYVCIHLCMSKQSFSDPRPSTLYLYLLSALFSFCWAIGTELWKRWAAACTNSLGSLARLFNPFHHGLTLMSPARLLQTCHHSRCTQDRPARTQTNICTSQHHTPLEGMLNDAALLHPNSPLTPCPLSSPFFPPLPPSSSSSFPSQIPEGASLAMSLKDKKENTLGRGTSPSNTPIPRCFVTHTHSHLGKYTHSLHHRKRHMLSWPREHDTLM